jgi:hypothetical protein
MRVQIPPAAPILQFHFGKHWDYSSNLHWLFLLQVGLNADVLLRFFESEHSSAESGRG